MVTETYSSTTAYSNTATVFLYPPVVGGSVTPATQTINYNTNASVLTLSGVSGGTNSYTYQWQSGITTSSFTNVIGATVATFTPAALAAITYFRVAVTSSGYTTPSYSNYATVNVNPQLSGGSVRPAVINITGGTSPGILSGSIATGGGCNGVYHYQWESSSNGGSFVLISGATLQNYTPGILTTSTIYKRQVTCGTENTFSNSIQVVINSGTPDINFVRTRVIEKTGVINSTDAAALTSNYDMSQATQYVDGLGRPIQTVAMQQSPLLKDVVSLNVYDPFGREVTSYLPYVAPTSDGNYKPTAIADQYNFNAALYPNEIYYYGVTGYEASPLNRVQESFAPGINWAGTEGVTADNNRHSVKMKYWLNTATDGVRVWTVTNGGTTGSFGIYATTLAYGAGQLFKNVTADEQGKQVIEFKDKEDKIILKKVQLTATADIGTGSAHTGWLCTYYIYDDLANLRCVIQPRGIELISSSWALTDATILAEQCFRYEYDSHNRMIVKKVPGAGQVNMIYDARDRLVMTQDANLAAITPSAKWMVILYDALNRPVQTGLLLNSFNNKTFVQNLTDASSSTTYPFTDATTPSVTYWEKLTATHYDDYGAVPSPLGASLNTTYINSTNFATTYNTSPDYASQIVQTNLVRGLVAWTQAKIIGTPAQFISQVNFYDDRTRLIQTQAINQANGVDIATTQYDFSGKILRTHLFHQKSTTPVQSYQVGTKNLYDAGGRLIEIDKNWNNGTFVKISSFAYNEAGKLKIKGLGRNPSNTSLALETLTYDYNVRGWLLGENRDFVNDVNNSNYFGFDLGYDKNGSLGTYAPQFNGNISGTIWKSKGDNQKRKYDFTYDAVNRLSGANFNQYISGSGTAAVFDKSAGVDFSVANMTYDANGNIMTMNQNGLKLNSSPLIDQLTYTYQTNTNKLSKVTDAVNDNTSTLGDFKYDPVTKGVSDYLYDVNGNLTLDNNKKISTLTYNYLNLPSVITVTGKGSITYTYDASGNKQKKVTQENNASVLLNGTNYTTNITTTTIYINAFVYESKAYSNASLATLQYTDVLQFTGHEEGRIRRKTDGTFAYDYFLKDHLGNVRMVLTEQVQTDIYPVATLETSNLATEQAYYNITTGQIVDKSLVTGLPAYVNHNIIPANPSNPTFDNANSAKVYKLNKNSQNVGLGITLRVMSGDKLDIYGKSYYFQNNTGGTAANTAVTTLNILTGLLGGPTGGATNVHGLVNPAQLNGIPGTTSLINTLLGNQTTSNNPTPQIPKAFINYILLDDHFKSVGSGFAPVGANSVLTDYGTTPALHNIPVTKNGFVYIYCSNESPVDVFFDNLQVMQTRGPILEETHYYPFGLTMAGISSKAAGELENKKNRFQNQEYSDDLGVDIYEFRYRMDDPQIGRFWQIDPLADKYVYNSTYAFSENKVIGDIELEGRESININGISQIGPNNESTSKDLSHADLNLRNLMNVSTATSEDETTSAHSDLFSAFQTYNDPTSTTVNDLTQTQSVSETTSTTSGALIEVPGGKSLQITTIDQTTTVNIKNDAIKSITTTNSISVTTLPVKKLDIKNNSVIVGTRPASTYQSPTCTTSLKLDKDVNVNLSKLSPKLRERTTNAIKSNDENFHHTDAGIKHAFKKLMQ